MVYNGLGNPRSGGALLVREDDRGRKRVVAIGDARELQETHPDVPVEQAPFAISPGPVNAHTHLDMTRMPLVGDVPYEEFMNAAMSFSRSGQRDLESAREGVDRLLASGVKVVGDIVTDEEVMRFLLQHEELQGVAYWEVIGPDPEAAPRILAQTAERLERFRRWERPGGMRVGLSPHTPHTVSAPLLSGLARLARQLGLPMQIHVAEAPGEVAFHRDGTGPLARAIAPFLPEWTPSGLTPVAYLASLGVLEAAPTLVHMVHVTPEDVSLVARSGSVVVHCPRSNRNLNCGTFPWELYARHGVDVALGTDSLGSSQSLDVADEVMAAHTLHAGAAPPVALLRAAVKGGYRALRMRPPRIGPGANISGVHIWPHGPVDPKTWASGPAY